MSADRHTTGRTPELWIRTTAGAAIGFGHLRRALTLAELVSESLSPVFLLDPGDCRSREMVDASGWKILSYPGDCRLAPDCRPEVFLADTRIVDGLHELIAELKDIGVPVVSIHDLGLSLLPSDVLVDGSICPTPPDAVAEGTRLLSGPDYQILDPAFSRVSRVVFGHAHEVRTVHVSLGGGDHHRLHRAILEGARRSGLSLQITALPGFVDSNRIALEGCDWRPVQFRWAEASEQPAVLLASADLAVTAGGVTAFEALCVGTPLLAVAHDGYQLQTLRAFEAQGACLCLGRDPHPDRVSDEIRRLSLDRSLRESMAACGLSLVDGLGAMRVAGLLEVLAENREIPVGEGARG